MFSIKNNGKQNEYVYDAQGKTVLVKPGETRETTLKNRDSDAIKMLEAGGVFAIKNVVDSAPKK